MTRILSPELVCELPVFAASGLVIVKEKFFLISDDEVSLVTGEKSGEFKVHALWEEELPEDPAERKKKKPDFESLYVDGESLFILPSFSQPNRTRGVRVRLDDLRPELLDLGGVRKTLEKEVADLNIEGAIREEERLLLFQRGNGKNGSNSVIIKKDLLDPEMKVVPLKLPYVGKIPLTITDTASKNGTIWFLAVAEDTESTYLDGEVVASFIGNLDESFTVKDLIKLDFPHKPEGMAFGDDGLLYLVTDDDSREKPSRLFKLQL